MKKAKRLLAVILAFVMAFSVFGSTAFAKTMNGDYLSFETQPYNYLDGVQKVYFTGEQGATYVLDLLDDLLKNANLVVNEDASILGTLHLELTNIDNVMYYLWNIVHAVVDNNNQSYKNVGLNGFGAGLATVASGILGGLLGNIKDLNGAAFSDQNNADRVCRNVPARDGQTGSSDIAVLQKVTQFLSDNRGQLKNIITGDFDFGVLKSFLNKIDTVGPLLEDFPVGLKNLLYSKLWNTEVDAAPSGWSYDNGIQQLVDWLLVDGTGTSADTGGKSVLGENFEPFLPAMGGEDYYPEYQNGNTKVSKTSINKISFYHLVNNAIDALLGGMVADLLKGVLLDALDIEITEENPYGDPAVLQDVMFSTIVGAIETLCTENGAPAIVYDDLAVQYPVPKIEALLDWFFNGGGLATFIDINENGIFVQDNFISLLNDVARMLPGLLPALGLEVDPTLAYSADEANALKMDDELGQLYITLQEEEIYIDQEATAAASDGKNVYRYTSDNELVNTTASASADYRNPTFIREEHIIPNSAVYASLIKVVLSMFIDDCYFPAWCDSIAEVGAYALASLAAQYIPQNNYLDRLDAYHYRVELNQNYTPKGTGSVEPIPYVDTVTVANKTVEVPRAAMDIGASLVAYLLNGTFDFNRTLGYWPETDTTFETWIYEFLLWGASTYMPVLTGSYDKTAAAGSRFSKVKVGNSTYRTAFVDAFNTAENAFENLKSQHPNTNNGTKCNIDGKDLAPVLYQLIDSTLFHLIPANWLPDEFAGGSSSAIFNDWLLNSVMNFDLQKLFSLFRTNSTGELNNSTTVVIIRLVDRVLGIVFGDNALLPACTESDSTNRHPTNLSTPTTVANFEGLLSASTLSTLVSQLLFYLNQYAAPLITTIGPLLLSNQVKSYNYTDGLGVSHNYIGSHQITYDELKDYVDGLSETTNAVLYNASDYPVIFTSLNSAKAAAEDIGLDKDDTSSITTVGVNQYRLNIPSTFGRVSYARKAQELVPDSFIVQKRTDNGFDIKLYVSLAYRDATSDVAVTSYDASGNVIPANDTTTSVYQKEYVYSNFRRAMPVEAQDGSIRAGTYGEVVYQDGYRTFEREDYPSFSVKYKNRVNNAVEDAEEFLGSYESTVQGGLGNDYYAWMMYFIKLRLRNAGLYDKNDDGVFDGNKTTGSGDNETANPNYDGFPGTPGDKTLYPFAGSGSTVESTYSRGNTTYNFAAANSSRLIQDALAYAAELEYDDENNVTGNHNVAIPDSDAESVVRLALSTLAFDITPDGDGNYNANSKQWATLTSQQLTTIGTFCQSIGWTFDSEEFKIYRPSFALITTSVLGNAFGSNEDNTSIPVTPASSYDSNAAGEIQDIQKAYVEFAKSIEDNDNGLKNHYDNISWRIADSEANIVSIPALNTIKFWLKYTEGAYRPGGASHGRNRTFDEQPAYTANSFDKFQQAYDYADCLVKYIENNQGYITQSLVTKAYKALFRAYKGLIEFGGLANWEQLEDYLAMAEDILQNAAAIGYTADSISELQSEYNQANNFYNMNSTSYDTEKQPEVDQQAVDLFYVINHMEFQEGIEPDITLNPSYQGSVQIENFAVTGDMRKLGFIYGFEEGSGLTETDKDVLFSHAGFTYNADIGNKTTYNGSGSGTGTGAYIKGEVQFLEQFRYFAVIFGDVTGDSRIDNLDAAVIGMIVNQERSETWSRQLNIAADVSKDGVVDTTDYFIVKHYAQHKDTAADYVDLGALATQISIGNDVDESWIQISNNG
ncbi:MAG: hypothetical protein K6F64_00650 [Clostridia bacterium]|nr:hypothetical protein [Clostridia bacterium]